MKYIPRELDLKLELKTKSVLLLGPRRTGKSQLIKHELKPDFIYDLLKADVFRELSTRPNLIRERLTKKNQLIVIDEIQKLPLLMDEVHSIIEEFNCRFLLTGSSARKLKRTHTGLMAGRARIKQLFPFVYPEIKNNGFSLDQIMSFGTLPPVFLSNDPWNELNDYAGIYLKEEILSEAIVRRIDNFSRFLEIAALTNGQILNFESVGSDAQVPARTVREYYAVLIDTLMGYMLEPIRSTKKRKSSATSKFYFFDIGVVNSLVGRKNILRKTKEFGDNLEHFVFLELQAYKSYKQPDLHLSFWGLPQKAEIDFIINEEIAIEVKATQQAAKKHFHGFELFSENTSVKRKILVCLEQHPRKVNGIEIMPLTLFLENLWSGQIT